MDEGVEADRSDNANMQREGAGGEFAEAFGVVVELGAKRHYSFILRQRQDAAAGEGCSLRRVKIEVAESVGF